MRAALGRRRAQGASRTLLRSRRRKLDRLAQQCGMAALAAEQGAGMEAAVRLETDLRAAAGELGIEVGELVRELMRRAPRRPEELLSA